MAPQEHSDPMTVRPEHSSAAETQENDLINFMKIEVLKEERKNPLKEIELS